MRKVFLVLLSLVLVLSISLISLSKDLSESIKVYRNQVKLEVNGKQVDTDNFLYRGTTYIPIRAAAELLGKSVGWNIYTNIASIDDSLYELDPLSKLLPQSIGFKWNYHGFAEYGHQVSLEGIVDESDKRTYIINGKVIDVSDGESTLDMDLSLKYIINGNKLVQVKTEEAMLDSKFDEIVLIQAPLIAGTFWNDQVRDSNNLENTLKSYIQKVEVMDGKKEYTVRYDHVAGPYYEIRRIREGLGVVYFEKLLELEESSFPVSYLLYSEDNPTQIDVTLYFPDNNADRLILEKRSIELTGKDLARLSLQALIDGPKTGLSPSIPAGVKLLDISIEKGVAFVDFSSEFISKHPGGSAGEIMTLYSIVNTLTEYPSIDEVQILVEGQTGKSLGNILLDKPLKRDPSLIK